jgi:hypothetical protein
MAKFYVTTNMKNNDKHFQFVFETTEVASVEEFIEALDSGRTVIGSKRVGSGEHQQECRVSINASIVGMVQEFMPRQRAE